MLANAPSCAARREPEGHWDRSEKGSCGAKLCHRERLPPIMVRSAARQTLVVSRAISPIGYPIFALGGMWGCPNSVFQGTDWGGQSRGTAVRARITEQLDPCVSKLSCISVIPDVFEKHRSFWVSLWFVVCDWNPSGLWQVRGEGVAGAPLRVFSDWPGRVPCSSCRSQILRLQSASADPLPRSPNISRPTCSNSRVLQRRERRRWMLTLCATAGEDRCDRQLGNFSTLLIPQASCAWQWGYREVPSKLFAGCDRC